MYDRRVSRRGLFAMHRLVPLNRLRTGETALVAEVVGRSDQVQRIKELGLRDGAEISMVRSGSPCIIRLAGQTLCIRANDILNVLVEPAVPV
jgi:ferrous iron transport protein A